MANQFRIDIKIDAATREQVVAVLEGKLEYLRASGWKDTCTGWGGTGGSCGTVYIGPRPLTLEERIKKLEDKERVKMLEDK